MLRILSLILSCALHLIIIWGALSAAHFQVERLFTAERVMAVDIVDLAPAPPLPPTPPVTVVPKAPAPQESAPAAPVADTPRAPRPVAKQAPHPVAERPAAAPVSPAGPPSQPSPTATAPPTPISPQSSVEPVEQAPADPEPLPKGASDLDLPGVYVEGDTVHVGGLTGFAGFADTFALEQCAGDTYTAEDYFGHYRVGPKRFVSVIDGRDRYGSFLFYDSQSRMLRVLKRNSQMIFTYGPGFRQQEPVVGSVTILPKKDRYNNPLVMTPAQLVWLPADPPMQYGTRIEFIQREVEFSNGDVALKGLLVVRPEERTKPGVVLLHCAGCIPKEDALGSAQVLALHGLAVLIYDVRGCGESGGQDQFATLDALAQDALAGVEFLRKTPGVDTRRVGLWGKDRGAQVAIAAARMSLAPKFLVATFEQAGPARKVSPAAVPDARGVIVPSLWLFSAADPAHYWAGHIRAVEQVRDTRGRDFTLHMLPDGTAGSDDEGTAAKPGTLRYVEAARGWLARR